MEENRREAVVKMVEKQLDINWEETNAKIEKVANNLNVKNSEGGFSFEDLMSELVKADFTKDELIYILSISEISVLNSIIRTPSLGESINSGFTEAWALTHNITNKDKG